MAMYRIHATWTIQDGAREVDYDKLADLTSQEAEALQRAGERLRISGRLRYFDLRPATGHSLNAITADLERLGRLKKSEAEALRRGF